MIASGLDESVPGAATQTVNGRFVDLFDANLPIVNQVVLEPRKRAYLFNLNAVKNTPQVVAAACRVQNERASAHTLSFAASGVARTNAVVRAIVPKTPTSVTVGGQVLAADKMDMDGGVLRVRFDNQVEPQLVEIKW